MNAITDGVKHISEITERLESQKVKAIPEFPKKVRGIDGLLYLQFESNYDLELFLVGLGINPYAVPVDNCDGFENALLIKES